MVSCESVESAAGCFQHLQVLFAAPSTGFAKSSETVEQPDNSEKKVYNFGDQQTFEPNIQQINILSIIIFYIP